MGVIPRTCGPCTICCLFFAVSETGKETGTWCKDCGDSGCQIHATRPQSCRNFECFWLLDSNIPEDLRPDALADSPGAELMEALLGRFDPVFVVCGEDRMMVRGAVGLAD